jgi:hypothetical protein
LSGKERDGPQHAHPPEDNLQPSLNTDSRGCKTRRFNLCLSAFIWGSNHFEPIGARRMLRK